MNCTWNMYNEYLFREHHELYWLLCFVYSDYNIFHKHNYQLRKKFKILRQTCNQRYFSKSFHSKSGFTLVTLPRTVTPYRDRVDGTRYRVTYQKLLCVNVTGLFRALSVFGRRIKGMIRLRPGQIWTCNVTRHHRRSFLFFFKA
jgi:hypothetical protein